MSEELKRAATDIFVRALHDCDIRRRFADTVRVEHHDGTPWLNVGGTNAVQLDNLKRIRVLAVGKAAVPMLDGLIATDAFAGCDLRGVLIAPSQPDRVPAGFEVFLGGHPTPTAESFAAARAALHLAHDAAGDPQHTLCIFLVSGGGSSMMELPLAGDIGVDDTAQFHAALVASGASIAEMNCVRKHFSAVKGGRLAQAAVPAATLSLLVSDVPADRLDALASGPTLPDSSTVQECSGVVRRYRLMEHFPDSLRKFFAGHIPETPKPAELNSPAYVLLSSEDLAQSALQNAQALGFHAVIDNTCDEWPYDQAADYLLDRMRELRTMHSRVCLISCGEIAVKLPRSVAAGARGGRNQHWALYIATRLRASDAPIAALSAGSDGVDGNSPAAGAAVDERTADEAAADALSAFDSFSYLNGRGATLITGPTGQNLRDLRVLLSG